MAEQKQNRLPGLGSCLSRCSEHSYVYVIDEPIGAGGKATSVFRICDAGTRGGKVDPSESLILS